MSIKEFRLDRKAGGAQALDGLWGPGPPGDLLYDMSAKDMGRGNHATRTGAGARTQLSDRGRALLFNGADDVWTTEHGLAIGTAAFTACAWVWLDSTVATAAASCLGCGDTAADEWHFRVTDSQHVANAYLTGFGRAGTIRADGAVASFHAFKNNWTHVAFTRADSDVANIYQNGLLMGTDATGGGAINTTKSLTIGGADGHAIRWWKGMISDVRYYSRALSLGQIAHIYNATRWTPYADIALRLRRRHVTWKNTVKVLPRTL